MISFINIWYTLLSGNYLNKKQIEQIQDQRLRALLKYSSTHSEFYRNLWQSIDVENCRLTDLPIVTKSNMMADFDNFVTDRHLKLDEIRYWLRREHNDMMYRGKYIPILTSGSTGENALVIYDRCSMDYVQAALLARHAGRDLSRGQSLMLLAKHLLGRRLRIAYVLVPDGNIHAIAKYPPRMHQLVTRQRVFSLFDPIEKVVEGLNEFQPHTLYCYSSYFDNLAWEQIRGNLNIRFDTPISFLAGGSEPLTELTNKLGMKAWNVPIQNHYGSTECFVMARTCQHSHNLHVMNDLCILEIVDRNNNPVSAGQVGEKILLTNLFNYVQPFIRYEIEDITGFLTGYCDCGLPFPTIRPIEGRTTDLFYVARLNGEYATIHPYRFIDVLRKFNEIQQYQIVQTARNELTCLYVPEDAIVKLEECVQRALVVVLKEESLSDCVTVKVQSVARISRHQKSGKFKSVVSMVGAPSDLGIHFPDQMEVL